MDQSLQLRQQRQQEVKTKLEEDLQFVEKQTGVHYQAQSGLVEERRVRQQKVDKRPEKHKGKTYVSRVKEKDRTGQRGGVQADEVKDRIGLSAIHMRARMLELEPNNQSKEFDALMQKVESYGRLQRETDGDTAAFEQAEAKAMGEMMTALHAFTETHVMALAEEQGRVTLRAQLDCAFELLAFFENRSMGNLTKEDPPFETVRVVPTHQKKGVTDCDVRKMPLFPHEPCLQDIQQGGLGDCYLLAGLASIISTNPQLIRDCMRDNGDGTVTVRLFQKPTTEQERFKPIHVIVTKQVPRRSGIDVYNRGSIWVEMIERAYAGSGLHLINHKNKVFVPKAGESDKERRKREAEVTQFNEAKSQAAHRMDLSQKMMTASRIDGGEFLDVHRQMPEFQEYFDKKGNIVWQGGSYADIEGGFSDDFIETLLGPSYRQNTISTEIPSLDGAVKRLWETRKLDHAEDEAAYTARMQATNDAIEQSLADLLIESKALMKTKKNEDEIAVLSPNELVLYKAQQQRSKVVAAQIIEVKLKVKMVSHEDMVKNLSLFLTGVLKERGLQKKATKDATEETPISMLDMTTDAGVLTTELLDEFLLKMEEELNADVYQEYKTFLSTLVTRTSISQIQAGDKLWNDIETALAEGKLLGAGTRELTGDTSGRNGETSHEGLYGTHAYTLLGTETRQVGSKEYRFIKLRNPWGSSVRDYYTKEGDETLYHTATSSGNDGVFLVEFHDFMRCYNNVYTN